MTREESRLKEAQERTAHWKRWGPYLAERQWGTVREDYSPHGTAWDSFPHDHARSRAYRWGEDGLGGICDNHGRLCFALALWNGRDPILKERPFGLTGTEGNHGEDVKEYYFYLDSTPTHSYMRYLYKYPQAAFPYTQLLEENRRRDRRAPEFELIDTGVFDDDRYFDVVVEYAKAAPDDLLIGVHVTNRGPEGAELCLLPTLWYRNTWSWDTAGPERPVLRAGRSGPGHAVVEGEHESLGARWFYCEGAPELLFTENETNATRLYGAPNARPYVKDGIDDYVVHGRPDAVNPARVGTKVAPLYRLTVAPGATVTTRLRLTNTPLAADPFGQPFDAIVAERLREADDFYATVIPKGLSDDGKRVMRQSFAGLLWSKQFYHYYVRRWLEGDPAGPPPPPERRGGRNHEWLHLYNEDVISMPDKWEYPWYAAWDLAFHMIPLALVDPDFAKAQLVLFLREWYMHPNGQIPAYEWAFGDVNPPVHAWAALRVYRIERRLRGQGDRDFLERVFHKLLLNFTWWVNRKDAEGRNVFQGGFLGLDNIGVFDRSAPLPTGGHIEQSDGTSWMGMYCLNMLAIALELAKQDPAYEDVASKFFEHFVYIAHAMHDLGDGMNLWDEQDGFYYDVLHADGHHCRLKVRSMVGLIPLFAVETLEPDIVEKLPGFKRRMQWFIDNHPRLREHVEMASKPGMGTRRLLSIVSREQLPRVLRFMLDEAEFLSPHGIRALSRVHHDHPYVLTLDGVEHRVDYEPAESSSGLFGGNSNWRGPVWFPVNYLLIESLQKFHYFYGDTLTVPFPTGGERRLNLWQVAGELSRRLVRIFLRGADDRRPVYGGTEKFQRDPHWRDLILFYEYFHGDDGAGIGASHQTGWTGLVAKLLQQSGE
ncbi:MAG: glucosidase [Candidatus Rokubacteria bacterium RIFCSPLOWO2_12_FULL_71_22]|nr:MAG: glucosidase [Candidatus Rokubacteria bacterium RIFCSPLOWO2_12_FULL_71_22]